MLYMKKWSYLLDCSSGTRTQLIHRARLLPELKTTKTYDTTCNFSCNFLPRLLAVSPNKYRESSADGEVSDWIAPTVARKVVLNASKTGKVKLKHLFRKK